METHWDLVVAVLALIGSAIGVVLAGGIHVGRITSSIDHLGNTLKTGFKRNSEEHDILHERITETQKKVSHIEGKLDRRNGNAHP